MFIGGANEVIVEQSKSNDQSISEFIKCVATAYVECGKYMQTKLPLDSEVLKSLSCIDPLIRQHSMATRGLKNLVKKFGMGRFLTEEGKMKVSEEIKDYQCDQSLLPYTANTDIVTWWASVMQTGKYCNLSLILAAALSIFHGPAVESSFSIMNNVLTSNTSRMDICTFSSIQTVKYALRSKNVSAVDYLKRTDSTHSPINKRLCATMRSAGAAYKQQKKEAAEKSEKRRDLYKLCHQKATSKSKAREIQQKRANEAMLAHQEKQKGRKRALQALADKYSKKRKY